MYYNSTVIKVVDNTKLNKDKYTKYLQYPDKTKKQTRKSMNEDRLL